MRYLGSSCGSLVVDPALVLRDIPGIGFWMGLADLCEFVFLGNQHKEDQDFVLLVWKEKVWVHDTEGAKIWVCEGE